jgi:hypothetical protein
MMPGPDRLTRTGVYRIVWLPGSDRLRGHCWCGSARDADDPVELWDWLLGHPEQHGDGRLVSAGTR